ncbi:ABC transporter permease [Citrifermentans bremense]|uniref:ABC transporter permease n=1 Tax=Citrifermentans bremense TaxID=60035 RepID=UPI0004006942|nr:ABC transporter permease [Citrifermentans bremense]
MIYVALKMLFGDRGKFAGLVFGIAFTSFLVTFAASYFAGFMTRGFALLTENGTADVWVMDPAVSSVDQACNMPWSALNRVRSVAGVKAGVPLALGTAEVRFPNGRFQPFQVIGVDDATLAGVPPIGNGVSSRLLRQPDTVVVDPGGTSGKLATPANPADQWPHDGPHLEVPSRELRSGDDLLVNDHRVVVVGVSQGVPRFPPRPLIYLALGNAERILPPERRRLTFVLASAAQAVTAQELARRIQEATGFRARTSADFKADTVRWLLVNSEDVGDIAAMLSLALSVGFGVTGIMLYIFTQENLRQYAVLTAMGTTPRVLLLMVFAQAGVCALIGTGLGIGLCGIAGEAAVMAGYPFRMMWYTPLFGSAMVLVVSVVAAALSARPVLKLRATSVFAAR